ATKEALHVLSELYAPPPSTSVHAKGKSVVRDDKSVDQDDLDETDTSRISGKLAASGAVPAHDISGDIAARARRNLRRDVESKLAESSRKFLLAFGEVDKVIIRFRSLG
ncbi:uncharacterized protein LAESUDRAFT_757046, partial [Laetiporus sulphureus 93-53]